MKREESVTVCSVESTALGRLMADTACYAPSWAVEVNKGRQKVTVKVLDLKEWDNKWPPKKLSGWGRWIRSAMLKVPMRHRHTATIEIESVGGWEGEHHAGLYVRYERPETNREMKERIDRQVRAKAEQEKQERATLALLNQKYK